MDSLSLSNGSQSIEGPTFLLQPQGPTLTTIATELRLNIYDYLSQTPAEHLLRRRAGIDDKMLFEKLAHTFDCSILFTCRKIYDEALPVFYASQTFHHSFSSGGFFSNNPHLIVNLSIDLVGNAWNADSALSNIVTEISQQCPQLLTLTIHMLAASSMACFKDFPADSAAGSVLRNLQPRLDSLSFIALGFRSDDAIPRLLRSIAEDRYWSSLQLDPGLLHRYWPYLTIPSSFRDGVKRACTRSRNFCYPPQEDGYVFKWTCRREVKEEIRRETHPQLQNWVSELERKLKRQDEG